jgi:peptidoglycan/xylan/chitin deacetylase (PgdA/CDA1 family)
MLNFRRFTLLFFLTLLSLNTWNVFLGKSSSGFLEEHATILYVLVFTLYFGVSFGMAFLPCSNFHLPVICHGNTQEKFVSVTFDDGPDAVKTPILLNTLRKHQVNATFFCIGKNLAGQEHLLRQMDEEGHLLGNHSFSHSKWFDLFPAKKMRTELVETDHLIKNAIGKSPILFRPPFGVVNPMVNNALKNMHWQAVCWSIRSLDTMNRDPQKTRQKILSQLKPGAIILLHDHTPFTENQLDDLLMGIKEAGYAIVPLDKLLKQPAYAS